MGISSIEIDAISYCIQIYIRLMIFENYINIRIDKLIEMPEFLSES